MGRRLQIDYINIAHVEFSEKTELQGDILLINKEDLLMDVDFTIFESINIKLVHPGDSVRLLGVETAIQPRAKVDAPENTYPGMIGKLVPAGEGQAVALRGVLVTTLCPLMQNSKSLLDMSGPAADETSFSRHHHIVIECYPKENVSNGVFMRGQLVVALKISVYLAKFGFYRNPDESVAYEMAPVNSKLPKVALIATQFTGDDIRGFYMYGQYVRNSVPFIIHPNELLDGALLYTGSNTAGVYQFQEFEAIKALYERHGRDIEFVGVVCPCTQIESEAKNVAAMMSSRLAKEQLHADIILNIKQGPGHGQIDQQMIHKWSEYMGMKAVTMVAGVSNERPGDLLVISDRNVDAIVQIGHGRKIEYPYMADLIGTSTMPSLPEGTDYHGPFIHTTRLMNYGGYGPNGSYFLNTDLNLKTSGWHVGKGRIVYQVVKDRKIRIVHYINQFFGQIGGEAAADMPVMLKAGAVGPGLAINKVMGEQGEIVATVICGDNYISEHTDDITKEIVEIIRNCNPDLVIAGPGFAAGRYGIACGAVCEAVCRQLGIPAVTALHEENPGVQLYSGQCYIMRAENSARKMAADVGRLANFALRLTRGEKIGSAVQEGYHTPGPLMDFHENVPATHRALDMALAKYNGEPFVTEVDIPPRDVVPRSELQKPLSDSIIALCTDGGLVAAGNPDHMTNTNNGTYAAYDIKNKDKLESSDCEVRHQGYNNKYILEDPNRLIPVDALRVLEKRGHIKGLFNQYYTTTGVLATMEASKKMGKQIARQLKEANVDAVILTST